MNRKYIDIEKDCIVLLTTKDEEILIDFDQYERIKIRKWSLSSHGYPVANINGKKVYLHRFIMSEQSDITGKVIDHINGNKQDNRKSNLRICTQGENAINKRMQKNNSSGTVGIYWNKRIGKWHVRVNAYGKEHSFGFYDNKEEAIKVRREAEVKIQKDFAYNVSQQLHL